MWRKSAWRTSARRRRIGRNLRQSPERHLLELLSYPAFGFLEALVEISRSRQARIFPSLSLDR